MRSRSSRTLGFPCLIVRAFSSHHGRVCPLSDEGLFSASSEVFRNFFARPVPETAPKARSVSPRRSVPPWVGMLIQSPVSQLQREADLSLVRPAKTDQETSRSIVAVFCITAGATVLHAARAHSVSTTTPLFSCRRRGRTPGPGRCSEPPPRSR